MGRCSSQLCARTVANAFQTFSRPYPIIVMYAINDPLSFKLGIPMAAICVLAVCVVVVYGIFSKQRQLLQWLILGLLFASNVAFLIAWSLSTIAITTTNLDSYVERDISKLSFASAVIRLGSMYLFVLALLVLVYIWVLVVHNDLYPGRSTVNVNRVAAIALVGFAVALLGAEIFLGHRAYYQMGVFYGSSLRALTPELTLFLVQGDDKV
jgi:hypothetical protein